MIFLFEGIEKNFKYIPNKGERASKLTKTLDKFCLAFENLANFSGSVRKCFQGL
jgi:hypothetical protein